MEYFDLVDENNQPLGKTKLRSQVHIDGDWHRAIDVWLLNSQSELLLQKRSQQKLSYPGLWEISCSGHISAGDESLETAVKELQEELGISVKPQDLIHMFSIQEKYVTNNRTFINNEFKDSYLLKADILLDQFHLDLEEVEAVKYINYLDFKKELKENPQNYVPHNEGYKKLFVYLEKIIPQTSSEQ